MIHHHYRTARIRLRLLIVALFTLAGLASPLHAAASDPPLRCRESSLPVTLAPGATATYQVHGWLCARPPLAGRIVQVLISGATYGHVYWDFPYQPERYSYVQALTAAGYATLNLDRIGIGQSDHPSPDQVTIDSNAFVIHQVVQALRAPRLAGVAFPKVVLVGHSLGSAIAIVEAATYHDVDGVILSGFGHGFGPGAQALPAALYPALYDPRFSTLPQASSSGSYYLTTVPGTRGLFYNQADADPGVIAVDEQTKETVTVEETNGFLGVVGFPDFRPLESISQGINVPVLSVIGGEDSLFCVTQACLQAEPSYYTSAPVFEQVVLPNAGHDLNLHLNALDWFSIAQNWTDRHFGATVAGPALGSQVAQPYR